MGDSGGGASAIHDRTRIVLTWSGIMVAVALITATTTAWARLDARVARAEDQAGAARAVAAEAGARLAEALQLLAVLDERVRGVQATLDRQFSARRP